MLAMKLCTAYLAVWPLLLLALVALAGCQPHH